MTDYFAWDQAKYGIHVPAMDREHEILINYMNKVHALHEAKATRDAMAKALKDLVEWTKKHFADEEAYMVEINFLDRRVHSRMHQQLLSRIGEFMEDFTRTGNLADDFFLFLKTWLKAHICAIDTKYAMTVAGR